MSPARRTALALSRIGFRLLLVLTVTFSAVYLSYSTSNQIKVSIAEARAYDRFVDSVLQSNVSANKDSIFSDRQVVAITKETFNPALLQKTTETFIDRWYDWLNGRSLKPDYEFNFTSQRQQLAEKLSTYAMKRVSELPYCTAFEAEVSLDPFKATCQPLGIIYADEQLRLQAELLESKDFFPKVIYTEADLPKTQNGKPIYEALSYAPFLFKMMPSFIVVMQLLLLLCAFMLVMLRPVRRNGWQELGRGLLMSGFFLAISAVVFGLLVPQMSRSFQSQFIGNGTDRLIGDIVRNLTVGFETFFINISLQIAAVGAAILLVLRFSKPASRYKGLEHVTGLVNAFRPTIDTLTAKRAVGAPVVTSERQRVKLNNTKKRRKKTRASKEVV